MKVAIIGAGNVGAQSALLILKQDLADIVLLDIQKDLAQAKAMDLSDAGAILGYSSKVVGTDDYRAINGAEIVVITAGFTRKPGMTREELLEKNAQIIKEVVEKIKIYAPQSIIIVVTNPLDVLTYLALKLSNFPPARVMGMAGVLDSARFSVQISALLNKPSAKIKTVILGSHSERMLILSRLSDYRQEKIVHLLKPEELKSAEERTRKRGTEIVELLKGGSAFFAPSAAVFKMVEAILKDKKEIMPVCSYLDGQYGLKDITLGTLARIGKAGIEEIVELDLTAEEKNLLQKSALEILSLYKKIK
ncbi:MAG: malate dehydrogenase [Candidatus Omnitrophica bacterium]|nr:malate dehydrogenase [Candidatus Omnitrophota bacterium]MCM8794175.1 malate dehydrogenase [Candidatus Omnitrophota bacterium]